MVNGIKTEKDTKQILIKTKIMPGKIDTKHQ